MNHPDIYLVGPDGHAYWLEGTLDQFSDPAVELWACPVFKDGRLDFGNRLPVADFDDKSGLGIPALTRARSSFSRRRPATASRSTAILSANFPATPISSLRRPHTMTQRSQPRPRYPLPWPPTSPSTARSSASRALLCNAAPPRPCGAPPCAAAGRPPGGGGQAKVPTRDELMCVDKCLTGTRHEARNRALFYLQLATGMRVGELARLDVGDVLHRGGIRREFTLGTADTKYGQPRTIYVEHPKARDALLTYLRQRDPTLTLNPRAPLFLSERGGFFGASALACEFKRLYTRAGVVGASSHSGRRWFMTELARAGIHPRVIQKRAGHASLNTTMRYIDVTPAEERKAVRAVSF